jgi:hypothetical protein
MATLSSSTGVESTVSPHRWGGPLRAWYHASIAQFLRADIETVLASLVANSGFDVLLTQRDAWLAQILLLREQLAGVEGSIFFEFSIPRMGRRIDVVVLTGPVVFPIEFKVAATTFDRSAIEQVWDYALDLKNFHQASHDRAIAPILVVTESRTSQTFSPHADSDSVYRPIACGPTDLRRAVNSILSLCQGDTIDPDRWYDAPYHPTPTIIEAARTLYAHHSVDEIARSDAGAENLRVTSGHLEQIVAEAKAAKRKVICFVTGVPGAGKTLVGLNLAARRDRADPDSPVVYLSGNRPLVAVLREALTRDEVERQRILGNRVRKNRVGESVKAFIQNVHHFRDEAVRDENRPPIEHVAIFDEAQRAWTLRQTENFMRRKKNIANFSQSEPESLISYMNRHSDWAVVVCLVGGGQEINIGEAGIDAWLEAVDTRFADWRMHISSRLTDSEYAAGRALDRVRDRAGTFLDDCLHLSVSMRSFRAENVSAFVKALLDRDLASARAAHEQLESRYPLAVTRDLDAAKEWVRSQARGSERYGLLASSKAMRLKPHAIDVRVEVDPVHWFLNGKDDTRSSYYLEDAATEFQVQGLEVDWACVTWDADLRYHESGWGFHDFRGSRWQNVNSTDNQRYLLNAYRVLLTRARQGVVIFVPRGDDNDPTRPPAYYNETYEFLRGSGIAALE